MYDYWCNWRKAYHLAATTYHQAMLQFYENEKNHVENTERMFESLANLWIMKWFEAFSKPNKYTPFDSPDPGDWKDPTKFFEMFGYKKT